MLKKLELHNYRFYRDHRQSYPVLILEDISLVNCSWDFPFEISLLNYNENIKKLTLRNSGNDSFIVSERYRNFLDNEVLSSLEELDISITQGKLTSSLNRLMVSRFMNTANFPHLLKLRLCGWNTTYNISNWFSKLPENNVLQILELKPDSELDDKEKAYKELILDYPIQTIDNIDISNIVKLNYDTVSQLPSTLLVRINNYGNALISNEDLLNIKLCWPATTPYDFQISHGYFHSNEISEELEDNLELYLIINYQFHAYTYDETKYLNSNDELEFQLYINKLPNKYLPIPLELYDFIVYLVDITIFLSWNVVPYLVHSFFL
ncbi:hypothetical protein K6H11_004748 [Candida tropicalis]